MAPAIYRAREVLARTALASAIIAAGYYRQAPSFVQDALRTIGLDNLQNEAKPNSCSTRCNERAAEIAGNQAAAEFAAALAQRDEADPNDDQCGKELGLDRNSLLSEMLHKAGGLVGGYL